MYCLTGNPPGPWTGKESIDPNAGIPSNESMEPPICPLDVIRRGPLPVFNIAFWFLFGTSISLPSPPPCIMSFCCRAAASSALSRYRFVYSTKYAKIPQATKTVIVTLFW